VTGRVVPSTSEIDTQDYHAKEFGRSRKIFFEKASKSNRIRHDAESEQLVGVRYREEGYRSPNERLAIMPAGQRGISFKLLIHPYASSFWTSTKEVLEALSN
jgi:hypothetical protein